MKKLLVISLLVLLIAATSFSLKLGATIQNFSGFIDRNYVRAAYVHATTPGFPAHGNLLPGDIITEALIIPNSQIYKLTTAPAHGWTVSFNPCNTLSNQLCMLKCLCVQYTHLRITGWTSLADMLRRAPFGSTVVMRVYRPSTCDWQLVSIVLDHLGCVSSCVVTTTVSCAPCVVPAPAPSPCPPSPPPAPAPVCADPCGTSCTTTCCGTSALGLLGIGLVIWILLL